MNKKIILIGLCIIFAINIVSAGVNAVSPWGYWKFEEKSGTYIYDSSGNNNNGTSNVDASNLAAEGIVYNSDNNKTAFEFNGVDEYISVESVVMNLTTGSTLTFWMKKSTTNYESLFGQGDGAFRLLEANRNGNNYFYFEPDQNNLEVTLAPTTTISDGNWHHYAFVFDQNGGNYRVKLYVDGTLEGTGENTMPSPATFTWNKIGHRESQTYIYGEYFNGVLDDIRVFNTTALTQSQIQDIYNYGLSAPTTLSPANNSVWLGDISLECSGATHPNNKPINYSFYDNLQVSDMAEGLWTTNHSGPPQAMDYELNYVYCRVTNGQRCDSYANMYFYDDNWTFSAMIDHPDLDYARVDIDGTNVWQENNQIPWTNITIDTSSYKEGYHRVNIIARATGNPSVENFYINWTRPLFNDTLRFSQSSSSTSYALNNVRIIGRDYEFGCRACDKDMNCSDFTQNNTIKFVAFSLCNGSASIGQDNYADEDNDVYAQYPLINFTFQDETNLTSENSTISIDSTVVSGSTSLNYIYSTNTENSTYAFCVNRDNINLTADNFKVIYGSSLSGDYPKRRFMKDYTLSTSSVINQVLYLLANTIGSYSTYIVTTPAGVAIDSVDIGVEKQISGTWTRIQGGITDGSGSIQFWLDPDFTHRFTFTKAGYETLTKNIIPTEANYQVQMQTSMTNITYDSDTRGMLWYFAPSSGRLTPNQVYNFTFNITTTLDNIYGCEFNLTNSTGDIESSVSGCTGLSYSGGNLSMNFTMPDWRIYGRFYVKIGDTSNDYITLDQDARWIPLAINATPAGTIWGALQILINAEQFGEGEQQKFSEIYFFFIALSIVIGILTFFTGVELRNPMASLGLITAIVLAFAWVGWFDYSLVPGTEPWKPWFSKFAITFIAVNLFIGHALRTMRRRT